MAMGAGDREDMGTEDCRQIIIVENALRKRRNDIEAKKGRFFKISERRYQISRVAVSYMLSTLEFPVLKMQWKQWRAMTR